MTGTIVNSYNLFVDSSTGRDNASKGDNYHLHLGNAGITCESGQFIRLTLHNFTMHKTFTDIHSNNNTFRLRNTTNNTTQDVTLTLQNNTTLNAVANNFANAFANGMKTFIGALNGSNPAITNVKPESTNAIGGNSDHIIQFDVNFGVNHGLQQDNLLIQCFTEQGDSYELLGGNRIDNVNDTTTSSFIVTRTGAQSFNVKAYYPAQRHTTPFVYLRTTGLPNTSLESVSLSHPTEDHRTDTVDSDILGRIPVDVEYCNYDAQTGREYFMNVKQKQINVMSLRLTDAKNRPLGRAFGSTTQTAAGTGTDQSTLGNLNFSAVIRVDIVQQKEIKELETAPVRPPTAARFENVLIAPKYGESAYGSGVGR